MQAENPPCRATSAAEATSKNRKKKKTKTEKDEDKDLEFIWICTECREAECIDEPDAPLVLCDGKCNRPFHPPCANLVTLPPDAVPWLCGDCLQSRHQCTVCKEYGDDDIEVFCCDTKGCGLFYHQNCLDVYNVHVDIVEEEDIVVVVKGSSPNILGVLEDCGGEEKKECHDNLNEHTITKIISRPKFKCPAHVCWTCADDIPPPNILDDEVIEAPDRSSGEGKQDKRAGRRRGEKKRKTNGSFSAMWGAKKEKLFRCLDCPISYHITCMPPTCSFHELAMLCHEHAHTSKLPYLDAKHSFQAKVEADAQKRIDKLKRREELREAAKARGELVGSDDEDAGSDEKNPFFPGVVGSLPTLEEDQLAEYLRDDDDNVYGKRRKKHRYHYCLPCDFKDEVHSKPPAYTHVNVNRYDPKNRPKRHPPNGECCKCVPIAEDDGVKSCGEGCLNRLSYTECVGDENLKSGSKNPYWNCNCGPNCGNRGMSKRQFAKCRPMREHGKGWGLIAVNGVKRGDLVQEYAGEIIDDEEKEERLKAWSRDHPNDPNFYVMHLEPGWYIDAREVANMARFINHSCDPNCKLVPTNVSGHIRVAIVCIKDVAPGGYLSYDYQFDTKDGNKFICRCGATNCRGTMKGGKNGEDDVQKKTKKQLFVEAKARIKRDKQFLQDLIATEKERLELTGPFVPGEDKEKAEAVAAGPNECYRQEVQESRIFLWRNARIGGDFSSRYWMDLARKRGKTKRKVKLTTVCPQKRKIDVISTISYD